MALGNKIQECRKALGLSQEELGQKLLVSRQTVSLWENDQSLPSLDNLTRLKEIFGISVDELLGLESAFENSVTPESSVEVPIEEFSFQYTEEYLKVGHWAYVKYNHLIYGPLLYLIATLVAAALKFPSWCVICIAIMFVGNCITSLTSFLKIKKKADNDIREFVEYFRNTKIYDEYVELCLHKNGKVHSVNKFYFRDFSNVKDNGDLITALCDNCILMFRKSDLKEDSLIYKKLNIKDCSPKKRKLRKCSALLFLLSIFSVLIGIVGSFMVRDIFSLELPQFWICFLLLPIPFISAFYGFLAKRKVGSRYVKNIVAGIIVAVFLLAIGSFSFVLNKIYSNELSAGDMCVLKTKEYTGIAIPEYNAYCGESLGYGAPVGNGVLYNWHHFKLYPNKSNVFEETLVHDSRWIKEIPAEMEEILVYSTEFEYNYLLLCNTETLEINTVPEKSGTYNFILIYYNVQSDEMLVCDYEMKYTK